MNNHEGSTLESLFEELGELGEVEARAARRILTIEADARDERLHDLLERNTEGTLSESEQAELEGLVEKAQLAQTLAMAVPRRPA